MPTLSKKKNEQLNLPKNICLKDNFESTTKNITVNIQMESRPVEKVANENNGKYLKIKPVMDKMIVAADQEIGFKKMKNLRETDNSMRSFKDDKIVWVEMRNFVKLPIALLMVKTAPNKQRKKLPPSKDKSAKSTKEKVLVVPAPEISKDLFHYIDSDNPISLKMKKKFPIDSAKSQSEHLKLYKYKCRKTNEYRIIKAINLARSKKSLHEPILNKELEILKLLKKVRNDYLIHIYDYQMDSQWLFVTMEFANGGDLGNYLCQHGPISETLSCHWFTQICRGLRFLHQKLKFAHRDIQIENIFLQNKVAKLANFMLAKRCENEETEQEILAETDCGMVQYFSPQKIQVQIYGLKYNPFADDIWAMGVVLFIMLHNRFPFNQTDNESMLEAQQDRNYLKHFLTEYPLDLRDFQLKLFTINEKNRITIGEIFSHRWILRKKLPIYFQTKTRIK